MRRIILILVVISSIASCKSKKDNHVAIEEKIKMGHNPLAKKIITNAEAYKGVRYKDGGTTKKGMDCSGLIFTAFIKEDIQLPRMSSNMAKIGQWVNLKDVKEGDLLFFSTKKNNRKVNHVGLVTYSSAGNVKFIHSTTSRGVITSSLSEQYWYFAFVQARRVL